MSKWFKGRYGVDNDDGRIGKSSPKYFTIREDDIDLDATEGELRMLYIEKMEEAFQQDVTPHGQNEDEFVAWARALKENR